MITVFTPTHKPQNLMRAYLSLKAQTNQDFEWIILLNNTEENVPKEIKEGIPYVHIIKDNNKEKSGFIGYYKKSCCDVARGEILVELDHDDALEPDCLEVLKKEFEDTKIDFVYSSSFEYEKGVTTSPWSEGFGWKYEAQEDGRISCKAFEPSPMNFAYIWYAPNHVRAWRTSFYKNVGGHSIELDVCDDFDLCCRTYIAGNVKMVSKPLYAYYKTAGENTCYGAKNAKIQELTHTLHDKYIEALCLKWCTLNNLKAVDVCCHETKREGFIGVDAYPYKNVDVVCDLNGPWDFKDGEVGLFRMVDAIEHLKDPIHTMKEIHRCLAPYGWALIEVPSTDGRGAFQDPTHVSFWNANSFWYYCKAETAKYINTPVKFQLNRILDYFPSDWHQLHNIPYTRAHLVKLMDDNFIPPKGREI